MRLQPWSELFVLAWLASGFPNIKKYFNQKKGDESIVEADLLGIDVAAWLQRYRACVSRGGVYNKIKMTS